MKLISNIIAVVFHPLIILTYLFLITMGVSKYGFGQVDTFLVLVLTFIMTFVLPTMSVLMMWKMKLISSIQMKDQKERIGPYILTGIFYLWFYINIKNHTGLPDEFKVAALGTTIALFLGFFFNIFTKVSIHCIAAGGMVAFVLMNIFGFDHTTFDLDLNRLFVYSEKLKDFSLPVSPVRTGIGMLLVGTVVIAGLVGTTRLLLKAHEMNEVVGGYFLGFFGFLLSGVFFL